MRAACKCISKKNLQHNLNTLADLAPNSRCVAVIKANAYGCEATQVLDALGRADLFATATIEEALALRQAGAAKSILLLEGAFESRDVALSFSNGFELVVATPQQLDWLIQFDRCFERLWFKLDTGMGRLGFQRHDAHQAMKQLLSRYAQEKIVIMTHFSDSDSPNRRITQTQIDRFDAFAKNYPDCQHSLSNSAGILAYPNAHRDYIRPGIALYGASPFAGYLGEDHDLRPVMTLRTRVLSVKSFAAGQAIGYGQTYRLPETGRIAICEVGYADGYSRFIPSGAPILIDGREYAIAGRVAMDMIAVAVDKQVKVGDEVVCWGTSYNGVNLPIERVCQAAQTIPHQLLTTVTERPKKLIIE
ncbi:MAG: alanine racemase [Gammaproteobacteria bacterium]|nr:MAG: alanine racemase [Gammaproteobacteria bacterium]